MHRCISHIAKMAKRQGGFIVAVCVAGLASGCGGVSMPMGSADVETPLVLTGSIPSASDVAFTDINGGDRRVIAQSLHSFFDGNSSDLPNDENRLSWNNPSSGNSGSINHINVGSLDETGCLDFQTTANTIAGIRLYQGTACRDFTRRVEITTLTTSET